MSVHFTAPKTKAEKADYHDYSEWLNSKKYKELTNTINTQRNKGTITHD